jgi:chloramphenicol 3-O-phosphotransferase
MEKGKIIILNGVSSAGKTTLTKVLQTKLTKAYYHISCDDFMNMTPKHILYKDFDTHINITQTIMHETIALFSNKGHNVIVDDVILDLPGKNNWMYEYTTMFEKYPVLFVRVDCSIEELERREIKRGDRSIGQSRWQLEHMDFNMAYDLVVNTHENTTEECADRIIAMLEMHNESSVFKTLKRYFEKE